MGAFRALALRISDAQSENSIASQSSTIGNVTLLRSTIVAAWGIAMRIDTLYEFMLLTTNLNFTETAKSFFISQSVLSNHISSLEKELGIKLFVRDSHSVRLTEAGAMFYDDAQRIIGEYEQALNHIAYFRDGVSSVLRLGFLLGSFGSFLPCACRRYHELNPDVEFSFKVLDIGDIQSSLNDNLIDIGFTVYSENIRDGRYEYCTLYKDEYKLAVPKTHPLASASSLSIEDLKDEVVLASRFNPAKNTLSQISTHLRNAGVEVMNDHRITDSASLIATLTATGRVALALDHLSVYAGDDLVFIPLENGQFKISAGAIWKKSKETDPMTRFVKYLRRATSALGKEDFVSRQGIPPLIDVE